MRYLLNRSLIEQVPIKIIYQGKDNFFTMRIILIKEMNEKYIKAYCYTKRAPRIFKVDSILAAAPVKGDKRERYYA